MNGGNGAIQQGEDAASQKKTGNREKRQLKRKRETGRSRENEVIKQKTGSAREFLYCLVSARRKNMCVEVR